MISVGWLLMLELPALAWVSDGIEIGTGCSKSSFVPMRKEREVIVLAHWHGRCCVFHYGGGFRGEQGGRW